MENEIGVLEEKMNKKVNVSSEKLKALKKKAELVFSAYRKESELTMVERLKILKSLKAELFITTKKELVLAENRLVKTLKSMLNPIWYTR